MSISGVVVLYIAFLIVVFFGLSGINNIENYNRNAQLVLQTLVETETQTEFTIEKINKLLIASSEINNTTRIERSNQMREILERLRSHDKVFEATGVDRITRTEVQKWASEFFPMLPELPRINSPTKITRPLVLAPSTIHP